MTLGVMIATRSEKFRVVSWIVGCSHVGCGKAGDPGLLNMAAEPGTCFAVLDMSHPNEIAAVPCPLLRRHR